MSHGSGPKAEVISFPASLELWLRRMERALHTLPESRRRDILLETEGHLLARAESIGLPAALNALGQPEKYARMFCDIHHVANRQVTGPVPELVAVAEPDDVPFWSRPSVLARVAAAGMLLGAVLSADVDVTGWGGSGGSDFSASISLFPGTGLTITIGASDAEDTN